LRLLFEAEAAAAVEEEGAAAEEEEEEEAPLFRLPIFSASVNM